MPEKAIRGWDVGGAHLKVAQLGASGEVTAVLQVPCPLWRGIGHLDAAVGEALARIGASGDNAITMTGEMSDVFECRADGVRELVDALGRLLPAGVLWIYAGADGFLTPADAVRRPDRVASANWLASAEVAASACPQGLFVDIGSTTTDLVPFRDGTVLARGHNDRDRLLCGELVYTGIARTPVFAVADVVPFQDRNHPLIPELFATMADVYRLCGRLPGKVDQLPAADGRQKTETDSARRLARTIGCDLKTADMDDWRRLAAHLAQAQRERLSAACSRVLARGNLDGGAPLVGAGAGHFLVRDLAWALGRDYVEFASLIPVDDDIRERAAWCAPAVAVAVLAARRR